MTIFDIVKAPEIASYWKETADARIPYLGETLFPADKKLGLNLSWLKGSKGHQVALKLSAFDAKAVPRARIGFEKLNTEMPFFKESMYIDEEMRQELNKVMETGNQTYIDAITRKIFDDTAVLLEAAAVARERMRMMLLTTGSISMASNGQVINYDYGVEESQKATVTTSWSDPKADIMKDIKTWQDTIEDATGVRPTRAVCDRQVWNSMLRNEAIIKTMYALSDGTTYLSTPKLRTYLSEELDLEVVVYSKKYANDNGKGTTAYVPADTFVLFPTGNLGKTWFGTTPEESDLMASSSVENVSIVDTGVAITTMKQADPVNVETKVTQICLPDFPVADQIFIADVTAA